MTALFCDMKPTTCGWALSVRASLVKFVPFQYPLAPPLAEYFVPLPMSPRSGLPKTPYGIHPLSPIAPPCL